MMWTQFTWLSWLHDSTTGAEQCSGIQTRCCVPACLKCAVLECVRWFSIVMYSWMFLPFELMFPVLSPLCLDSLGHGSFVPSTLPPAPLAKSKGTAFSKSFLFHLYEKRRLLCECLRALQCNVMLHSVYLSVFSVPSVMVFSKGVWIK